MKRALVAGAAAVLLGVPALAQVQPAPAPAHDLPAQLRPAPAPMHVRPGPLPVHPAPVAAHVQLAPAAVQIRPAPATVQIQPAPAAVQIQPAPAPVPILLPYPLPTNVAASRALFDAMLAIARAQQIDPQAAQTASFEYMHAVQQYRIGSFAEANISARLALSTAAQAQVRSSAPIPLPTAALVSVPGQVAGLGGGLYGADAAAIDADAFLALARGTIDECATRRDRRLAGARQHYTQAQQDFAVRNWQATRSDAKAAIDACAKGRP